MQYETTKKLSPALAGRSFHTAPKSIRGRVLSYLNTVSIQARSTEFDIPLDRQQLADYLNVERTALSKELGKMRADGLLRCRRNHFVLLHKAYSIYIQKHKNND